MIASIRDHWMRYRARPGWQQALGWVGGAVVAGLAFSLVLTALRDAVVGPTPHQRKSRSPTIPANARVLDRAFAKGQNPSANGFKPFTPQPLRPHVYLRVTSAPAARITVNGSIHCSSSEGMLERELPVRDGRGQLVVPVRLPRGAKPSWRCDPIVVFGADTDPGKVTLLSGELIAGGGGP
jgi:hypothetical protein